MNRFILLAFCLFNLSAIAQHRYISKLDSLFILLEKNNKAIGSFAVSKGGKIIYKRSVGISNIRKGRHIPASENTVYRIGSVTKMYTAAIIFQLVDEGKLSLDTKVSTYYPQIPNADKMTIEMLLNHTNGLYDYVNDGDDMWVMVPRTKKELLEKISSNKPHFAPGEDEAYSNSGYLLAAYIIEDVTGKSYNKNLQKRICKKLGLKNTHSLANNTYKNEAGAFMYTEGWEEVPEFYFPNAMGAGDIIANPSDLITFTEALIAGKLFSSQCLEVMKNIRQSYFGTGVIKIPFYDKTGYGHLGGTFGTSTVAVTYPEGNITIAFSVNGGSFNTNEITAAMVSAAYGKQFELPVFTPEFKVPSDVLDLYAGTYSSPDEDLKIIITRKKGSLFAQGRGEMPMLLEATTINTFKYEGSGFVVEFDTEKNQLTIKQSGEEYVMSKE